MEWLYFRSTTVNDASAEDPSADTVNVQPRRRPAADPGFARGGPWRARGARA